MGFIPESVGLIVPVHFGEGGCGIVGIRDRRRLRERFDFAEMVVGLVPGDSEHPGGEWSGGIELMQVVVGGEEGILEDVLSVGAVAAAFQKKGHEFGFEACDEGAEC